MRLSYSIKPEKSEPKFFFTGKIAFVFKIFFFNNFLGPKEMILSVAQQMSKNLVHQYRFFPEDGNTR